MRCLFHLCFEMLIFPEVCAHQGFPKLAVVGHGEV